MGYVIVPWFGYQFCIPYFKFEFLCRTFGPWFFWQFNQTWLAQIWRPEASTSVFWKGTQKHGRGKWQGKTSMDSEVRSCWERFQDIYIIFNAMKLLSYKIDFCIAFAARYWNYQFWRETFSEMCKNSNSITWSDICKLYTKLCHLSRILQESTTCDIYIYISESFSTCFSSSPKTPCTQVTLCKQFGMIFALIILALLYAKFVMPAVLFFASKSASKKWCSKSTQVSSKHIANRFLTYS